MPTLPNTASGAPPCWPTGSLGWADRAGRGAKSGMARFSARRAFAA